MSFQSTLFQQGATMMTPISTSSVVVPSRGASSSSSQREEDRKLQQESLREQMEVMFWQESAQYKTKDYLVDCLDSDGNVLPEQEGIMSEQWRTRMCEWAYQCKSFQWLFCFSSLLSLSLFHHLGCFCSNISFSVFLSPLSTVVDHFELPRDVVGTCTNLLDRYLTIYFGATAAKGVPAINKKEFQLVTMSCLYLAMKLKGQTRIPLEYMVQLSRGTMNVIQLQDMEMELLSQLSWLVNPPTAFDFLKHYLQLLQPEVSSDSQFLDHMDGKTMTCRSPRLTALEDLAAFLVELSVLDYYFVNFRASTVALAALFNAMDEDPLLESRSINPFLEYKLCHGYDCLILPGEEGNIFLCRQRLGSLHRNSAGPSAATAKGETNTRVEPESPAVDRSSSNKRMRSPVSVAAIKQFSS